MYRGLIVIALIIGVCSTAKSMSLEAAEDSLVYYYEKINEQRKDKQRMEWNQKFYHLMEYAVEHEDAFDYSFSKLEKIAVLTSEDELVRIVSWNIESNFETNSYYTFILHRPKKRKRHQVYALKKEQENKTETGILTDGNWFGALYYDIIHHKVSRKEEYYLVLGWDGQNSIIHRKVIDVIDLNDGKLKMGAPLFFEGKVMRNRVIFSYASDVTMTLRHEPNMEMIVFDALAPHKDHLEGHYQYYGPVLNRNDAYVFEEGKLVLKEDVDARLQDSSKEYNDPE